MGSNWLVGFSDQRRLPQLKLRHVGQEGEGLFSVCGGTSGRWNSQCKFSREGISMVCSQHIPKL